MEFLAFQDIDARQNQLTDCEYSWGSTNPTLTKIMLRSIRSITVSNVTVDSVLDVVIKKQPTNLTDK